MPNNTGYDGELFGSFHLSRNEERDYARCFRCEPARILRWYTSVGWASCGLKHHLRKRHGIRDAKILTGFERERIGRVLHAAAQDAMSRHGRAIMPLGKFRGAQVSVLPNDYLLWFFSNCPIDRTQFNWLFESVGAELRHRGFNTDGVQVEPTQTFKLRCTNCGQLFDSAYQRPLCQACKTIEESGYQTIGTQRKEPIFARPRRAISLD
jgi:uncharacterized protein (DUF3820 family)